MANETASTVLARKLLVLQSAVAEAVTDDFFRKHPDLAARWGARGREFCSSDARTHIQFLSAAVQAGSTEAYAEYARWVARLLTARGIAAHLHETFSGIEEALRAALPPEEYELLEAFLAEARKSSEPPERSPSAPQTGHLSDEFRERFLDAILNHERRAALRIVDDAFAAGVTPIDLYADVFAASLHQIGDLWEANKIGVAQEHIATAITRVAIAAAYARLARPSIERGTLVVTGVAGELHQVGASLFADFMETNGWDVRFVGTNLPNADIVAAVEQCSADVLGISTTLLTHLPVVVDLITDLRARLGARAPKIILGGAAYRSVPHFARKVGAIGAYTDLRAAVEALET
jgi:MerR family transcriptional regulator, light-induced transcriptional regulator